MEDTIEKIWNKVKTDILESAETVLGHQSRKHSRQWFYEDCWHAVQKKNQAYREQLERPTRTRTEKYRCLRREADKICRSKKRKFMNDQLLLMESNFTENNAKQAFREVGFYNEGF
jgi:type III secretory pathway component EscR